MEVYPEIIGHEDSLSSKNSEDDEEDDHNVVPSARSYPRLAHPRRKARGEKDATFVADSDDDEDSSLVSPHVHHHSVEERPKISVWAASSNLVTCMVGASVLSLPRMIANNGWALGPGMVLLAGLVSYSTACMVDQAIDRLSDAGHHPKNIGDVVQECFGRSGRSAVLFLTCVFQISKCGVYFVVIGANLNYAVDAMSSKQWAVAGAALCMRLMFVQDISVISKWSFIGVLASGVYVLTISAGGVEAAAMDSPPTKNWPSTYNNLLADFAVMVYAYSPCDVLPVLKADMKEPRHLHHALRLSFLAVIFIYMTLGSVAYLGWGNQVAGNVLLSMCDPPGCPGNLPATVSVPGKKWLLGYFLAGAVVSNLMVTAPVMLYCVFRMLENEHALVNHAWVNVLLRMATVITAVLVALFLPHFTEILAVISTGLLTLLQVFVPVAVTVALNGFGFRILFISVLGTGMLTAGMSSALRNLYMAIAEG